jgi:hypothetical protein
MTRTFDPDLPAMVTIWRPRAPTGALRRRSRDLCPLAGGRVPGGMDGQEKCVKGTITPGTFNCENLFTRYRFRSGLDPAKEGGFTINDVAFDIYGEDNKRLTAQAIRAADADIFGWRRSRAGRLALRAQWMSCQAASGLRSARRARRTARSRPRCQCAAQMRQIPAGETGQTAMTTTAGCSGTARRIGMTPSSLAPMRARSWGRPSGRSWQPTATARTGRAIQEQYGSGASRLFAARARPTHCPESCPREGSMPSGWTCTGMLHRHPDQRGTRLDSRLAGLHRGHQA